MPSPLDSGSTSRRRSFVVRGSCGLTGFAALAVLVLGPTGHLPADDAPALPVTPPAATEEEAPLVGLTGLLPGEVPESIHVEAFGVFGPNWEAWAMQTVELLDRLHQVEEGPDVSEQREIVKSLESRLRVMRRAINEPQYAMIRDRLIVVYGRLARRVAMYQAALDTLELDPVAGRARRAEAARPAMLAAVQSLASTLDRIQGGRAWLSYVNGEELRAALADPKRIEESRDLAVKALAALRARDRIDDAAQRAFLEKPAFASLEAALARFVAAAAPVDPEYPAALREALAALVGSIEDLEKSNLVGDASGLRDALADVRRLAPDGGDLVERVVRMHYLNYNVVALVSEDFAARFVSDSRCEFAPVRDYGLGARIRGWQKTEATGSFDLKPSDDGARFELLASGVTHSNTVATTDEASVQSVGRTLWRATKTGVFDGEHFLTQKTMVSVNPSTTPVDASTNFDWIPIIGSIARDIALDEARQRGPQARAFAARRTIGKLGPEFDRKAEETFAKATRDLQTKTFVRLKNAGLYSSVTRIQSSEEYVRFSSRVGEAGEPAGAAPEAAHPLAKGITLHLHESFLNNAANRLEFNGREMTERDVRRELGAYLSQLTGAEVDLLKDYKPKEQTESVFLFDEHDPVRFQIDEGLVNVVIRTGLRKEGREDIPTHVITVPLRVRVTQENVTIERAGAIRPVPVKGGLNIGSSVVIRTRMEESFQTSTTERRIEFKRTDKPSVVLWVTRVKALDGWLSGWAD